MNSTPRTIRLNDRLEELIQREADAQAEGNFSLMVRQILRQYFLTKGQNNDK